MTQPDLSILMAARNAIANYPDGMFVRNVANPFFCHDGISLELVICDDASDDTTAVTLEAEFSDYLRAGVLKIKRHGQTLGAAAAYQSAAEAASGRYCILQSVRSWYEPGSLTAMVAALDAHPGVGFVYGATQYHGSQTNLHSPPPYERARFFRQFDSLFGFMFRREALDKGCQFVSYFEREGRAIDVCDYDFVMQLICKLGWRGLALDRLCLNYFYSGEGQMTNLVHEYQSGIDAEFGRRWGRYA